MPELNVITKRDSRSMSLDEVEARIDSFDKLNRLRSLTDAETDQLCWLFERRRDHLSHRSRRNRNCAND